VRGTRDVTQGIAQLIMNAVQKLPAGEPPIEVLRRAASPEEQALSDHELRARWHEVDPTATYTGKVNEEMRRYAERRALQGDGIDWMRVGGNVAATSPLALVTGGTSLPAIATTGATQGGISGLLQFDPTNSAAGRLKSGGLGLATGAVFAPAAKVGFDKLGQVGRAVAGGIKGLFAAPQTADDLARAVPQFADLPEAAQRELLAEVNESIARTGTFDTTQLARKANLVAQGVTPTRAMVTRNPADWTRERNLQKLAGAADPETAAIGQQLTDLYTGNDAALSTTLTSMADGLPQRTQEGHGLAVMAALEELAEASQKNVSKIYAAVREAKGSDLASDARHLATVLDDLRDSTYAEKLVSSVTNRLRRLGMVGEDGAVTRGTLTVGQAEELRKFVNALPNDHGKREVIRAIDQDVLEGMGEDAFAGARATAAERFAMLENPATQRALGAMGELAQGKTAQNFLQSQVINASEQDVASLMRTLARLPEGRAAEAVNSVRAGLQQYLRDKAVNPNSQQFSGAALNRALKEVGETKLMTVLGADQYRKLQDLARAGLDATYQPPFSAVNTSNTAPALVQWMERMRASPILGPLVVPEALETIAARREYTRLLEEARRAGPNAPLPELPEALRLGLVRARGLMVPALIPPIQRRLHESNEH